MTPQHSVPHKALLAALLLCFANYYNIHYQTLTSSTDAHFEDAPPQAQVDTIANVTIIDDDDQPITSQHSSGIYKFRKLNVAEFPYKCGIVLFYHIPCTGKYCALCAGQPEHF